ncbi:hypothetical protein NPIL_40261 [Nephila pilipes]|uniref:Uncharacterized protein n=1 Tax=Nephila pilipes TaxID=299642 RepID=A0A8X6UA45_NEPPI|nr:hypothetical protein NPIL_40261 [Nephila pilipes]
MLIRKCRYFATNNNGERERKGKSGHIESKLLQPNNSVSYISPAICFRLPTSKAIASTPSKPATICKNPQGAPLGTSNHTKATAEKNPIKKGPAFEELDSLVVRRSGNISSTLKKTSADQRKIVGRGVEQIFEQYAQP